MKFYNDNGKLLYQSPIMIKSTAPVDFEFETGKALKLKVVIECRTDSSRDYGCYINNFAVSTTDYK